MGAGEVVSLIGESGSGKSTIGKMILRLLRTTRGTIRFDGTDIATLGGKGLRTYYGDVQGVFQDPFSSYNPIFKADRVFTLLRGEHFSGLSGSEWSARLQKRARGREPEPGGRPRQVSASAQRRSAAAHAHRAGPPARHPPPRRRRDHQHARRLHAHRRAQPARGPEVARSRRALHHPRPLARQLHQRQDRDPATRQCRRGRHHRAGLRKPAPSVHAIAPGVRSSAAHEVEGH